MSETLSQEAVAARGLREMRTRPQRDAKVWGWVVSVQDATSLEMHECKQMVQHTVDPPIYHASLVCFNPQKGSYVTASHIVHGKTVDAKDALAT